ncbi:NfeD family protein [Actinopolymorpha sp. B11F2]|uniref:NfeD family protein n=1 Tax=Actinopolymorpha sp. B11F2 TaxID=3160862 RepID=UPI0032E46E1F
MPVWVVWSIATAALGTVAALVATLGLGPGIRSAAPAITCLALGGVERTAISYDPKLIRPDGTTVEVLAIDGATAFVHPWEEPWPN